MGPYPTRWSHGLGLRGGSAGQQGIAGNSGGDLERELAAHCRQGCGKGDGVRAGHRRGAGEARNQRGVPMTKNTLHLPGM